MTVVVLLLLIILCTMFDRSF